MELLLPDAGLIFWMMLSCFVLWLLPMILALMSILRNNFRDTTIKLIWVLVVIMLPLLGAILYYFIGRNQILKTI